MALVNAKQITTDAFENKWAVPHININNLEWTKAVLETAEENRSPVILGASRGALKYMGGLKTVYDMVKGLVDYLQITVPVVLHLDHGTYEEAMKALDIGYPSVMYDGSHEPFKKNLERSKLVIARAKTKNASVEVEVGMIGGEEDGVKGHLDSADPLQFKAMQDLGPDMIAIAIGNIHGSYPSSWTTLDFEGLRSITKLATKCLVLHGGSGIPKEQVQRSILNGISKVNVNTEIQMANAAALRAFVSSGTSDKGKNYDPRKFLRPGYEAIKKVAQAKMQEFGSINKA